MKTPTLEEVKEYFKDAEVVMEICYLKKEFKIDFSIVKLSPFGNYVQGDKNLYLWSKEKGYAKIISYKNEYKITKETIVKYQMKDEFPECFKKELIVGRWYKWNEEGFDIKLRITEVDKDNKTISGYGFRNDEYIENGIWYKGQRNFNDACSELNEMTPKEVEGALSGEAKKRGFVEGIFVNCLYDKVPYKLSGNPTCYKNKVYHVDSYYQIWMSVNSGKNAMIYNEGIWSQILPNKKKMTISEIEEKYNIEVVRE